MADTLADLIQAEAVIYWRCEVCRAQGRANLEAMQQKLGPAFSLTNRRPSCRLCPGRVVFEDRSRVYHRSLDTISDSSPEWWAYGEAERRRLNALGWRVVMGKWEPPSHGRTESLRWPS